MNFELKSLSLAQAADEKSGLLLVLLPTGFKPGTDAVSSLLAQALKAGDFDLKAGNSLSAYRVPGVASPRLVLASVGEGQPRLVRQALQGALAAGKATAAKQVTIWLAPGWAEAAQVRAVLQSVADAAYVYTTTKSKAEPRKLQKVTVAVEGDLQVLQEAFARGAAAAQGVELARELGNRPPNHATPTALAAAAKALAKGSSGAVDCQVLLPAEIARLRMGAFMGVAQGSAEAARFIVLKYQGAAKTEAPVVLVGKGITFDTGGISIKPAAEMDEMKFDMCGAASVLGVFESLARLKPAVNVVGLVPACENMPDGRALKPGDVVTSMSGQTIEVLNTDAEGRLILCDALAYADRFKPRAVIDIATLTGACVIALGAVRSGLFASDEALGQALQAAGDAAQDLCWPLPLDEDYAEGLKSNFADVANVGGRAGGAITAAKFLQRFAGHWPWAHLDIAGTAWRSGASKGATGRPVALLLEYLCTQAGASAGQLALARKARGRKAQA